MIPQGHKYTPGWWAFFVATKLPARRLACGSGAFKGYVAVAAYYVDLLRGPDDSSALGANVLDAAVLAGAASAALYGDRGFFAVIVIIVALYLDLESGLAAGGEIIHTRLLGQPFGGFICQGCYRPAILCPAGQSDRIDQGAAQS